MFLLVCIHNYSHSEVCLINFIWKTSHIECILKLKIIQAKTAQKINNHRYTVLLFARTELQLKVSVAEHYNAIFDSVFIVHVYCTTPRFKNIIVTFLRRIITSDYLNFVILQNIKLTHLLIRLNLSWKSKWCSLHSVGRYINFVYILVLCQLFLQNCLKIHLKNLAL